MIISEQEFLDRAQLDRETLEVWIEEEWLVPSGTATGVAFSEADLARAELIRDLMQDLGVNDEGVGWHQIAVGQGRAIDKTPPPWRRPSTPIGFPLTEQAEFFEALTHFYERLDSIPEEAPDVAAATFLAPHGRWNELINAVATYASGDELERISVRDFQRYDDSGVNWRVVEGYGAVIAAHGDGLPVVLAHPRSASITARAGCWWTWRRARSLPTR
jgi:hypothetical protein